MSQSSDDKKRKPSSIRNLDDSIVKYNYHEMQEQLQYEFSVTSSSRALVDQRSINNLFNLDDAN